MWSTENPSFPNVSGLYSEYIYSFAYAFATVTKIRYITVDAQWYIRGETKHKSCTVLIEGKDTQIEKEIK